MPNTQKIKCKVSIASVTHLITDHRLLITMSALALTSCMGVYEGGFECPPGEGVGCKSISQVNQMVNDGELPKGELSKAELSKRDLPKNPSFSSFSSFPGSSCEQCGAREEDQVILEPAQSLQIWYAPSFETTYQEERKVRSLDDSTSI